MCKRLIFTPRGVLTLQTQKTQKTKTTRFFSVFSINSRRRGEISQAVKAPDCISQLAALRHAHAIYSKVLGKMVHMPRVKGQVMGAQSAIGEHWPLACTMVAMHGISPLWPGHLTLAQKLPQTAKGSLCETKAGNAPRGRGPGLPHLWLQCEDIHSDDCRSHPNAVVTDCLHLQPQQTI